MRKLISMGALVFFAGCGGSEIGESCDEAGSEDECVSGAICANESAGNVCREICVVQEDCPAPLNCNGLSGSSTKACQP
jgi:hypothetical protein